MAHDQSLDEHVQRAARTYGAAADHYRLAALSFWDRFGAATVSRLRLAPGGTVLDLCCGAGASAIPAAYAVGPAGRVLGIDVAAPQLDLARARAAAEGLANIEFRYGDATRTGLPDGGFDAVVCVFGVFFAPDMTAFVREMWRLVRPGGVLAVTTWGPGLFEPANSHFWRCVGEVEPALFKAFNPWDEITTPAALAGLFSRAGVPQPAVVPAAGQHRLDHPHRFWDVVLGSGYRATVDALSPGQRDRVRERLLSALRSDEVTSLRTDVVFGTAERPGRHELALGRGLAFGARPKIWRTEMVAYAIDPASIAMPASAVRTCTEEDAMDGNGSAGHGGTTPLAPPAAARFPLPSEIADAPGAEGWRSMYPYFTRFQPEDDKRFWFYNSMHFPEPMPAFDTITAEIPYSAIGANTARVFVFPTTLGIEHRIVNGRVYITANPVTDADEIARRAAVFGERAGYYYENWDTLQAGWKTRIKGLIDEIASVTVPELPEFDDAAVVTGSTGVAQNHYVRENFHRCLDLFSKMWHHHTEFLMLGYGAYVVFFQFCKQAFPEISDQAVARMVAGIDVIMYRPDDELRNLARVAVEAGVDDLFTEGCSPSQVLAALADRGEGGKRWLAAFEQAREPWFNVSTGDGFYHHHRSWSDDLTVPFAALPRYVAQVRDGLLADRPTEALRAERERIAAEYRDLLGTEEERAAFDQMLGLCRVVFPYVEDHKFYCEHWFTTLFFGKIRAFGALLARFGVLAEAEDVFQLHHTEVDQALSDVMLAWAAGGPPLGAAHFQPIVAERKRMLEALRAWSPPPALGPVPEALNDPAVHMLWGVTQQTIEAWLQPDEGEIRGCGASSGIVEGPARVLTDVNQIGEVRDGEILVCPVTAPSWAPVFGKIRAAVSDIGGSMSHAAIVAREYGMPAVVGTGDATKRISTGQRVRVDGDRGIVQVLGVTGQPHLVLGLADVGAADAAWAGGKAAALGELARAGIPIPRGYVVTVAAFNLVMPEVDPSGAIRGALGDLPADDLAAIARAAAALRARIRAAPLPPAVAAEVTLAYRQLGAQWLDEGAVAVRSSATMEDSPEASFAGLQDSYLAVCGADAVLDRVRSCWASLYNDESVSYRRRRGTGEAGLAMGVVVQRMVSPRAAGVMFTRSPVTGDRSVVAIEGTWGLGSALVAGEVTPDSFTVSKVTGEITGRRVSAKLRAHSFGPNDQGISAQPMPTALRRSPCLSDDEARALALVGRRVEEHYGVPQDIEWALLGVSPGCPALHGDPADRIVLLQSRPETVWAARERPPVATPKPRASDHVLAWLEKAL